RGQADRLFRRPDAGRPAQSVRLLAGADRQPRGVPRQDVHHRRRRGAEGAPGVPEGRGPDPGAARGGRAAGGGLDDPRVPGVPGLRPEGGGSGGALGRCLLPRGGAATRSPPPPTRKPAVSDLRAALEAAIAEDPDDLASHAAYADYLVEQGDPRGEFIQVQFALESVTTTDQRRQELQAREKDLLAAHEAEWL